MLPEPASAITSPATSDTRVPGLCFPFDMLSEIKK